MGAETSYDVFLSYNSLDHEYVERIAKELKSRGCTSFIDRWYMKPGRNWVEAGKGTTAVPSSMRAGVWGRTAAPSCSINSGR